MKTIKDLLNESTSDKQSIHRYGFIYDLLLNKVYHTKGEPLNVLEIGVSCYGEGSFKALSKSDMVGNIVGLDIMPYKSDLLGNMEFVNMSAYEEDTIDYLKKTYNSFDIIIDDGRHEYAEQAFVLSNYERLLADDGIIVTEDVGSLRLIDEQGRLDNVWIFDGWGNLELGIKSLGDQDMYYHDERIIVKSKSHKLTDHGKHEDKQHIPRLPTINFKDYEITSEELAISIPLFHPDLDNTSLYNVNKFQQIHCRGAVWAAMSFVHNTDLSDKGVPVYFHIEQEVWDDAKPIFEDFKVPEKFIKRMELPRYPDLVTKTDKPLNSKILMALIDDTIDPDVLLFLDSDLFVCVTGNKMPLFDKLTQPLLKRQPTMTYFRRHNFDYWMWVSIVMACADLPTALWGKTPLNEIEKMGYEKLGFVKELDSANNNYDKVNRFYSENFLQTFPREHASRDFCANLIGKGRTSPYPLSIWAEYNHPIVELDGLLNIPCYDFERDFIHAERGRDCFAHIRVQKQKRENFEYPSLVNVYWDTFLQNVSRYVY